MDADVREKYLEAGRIAGEARDLGASLCVEGARLIEIAEAVEGHIVKEGAEWAFPCCISLNEDAAHYSPKVADTTVLKRGDVVKLDCGAHVEGYIGDTAISVEVGTDTERDLLEASRAALDAALKRVRADVQIREIGEAVENAIRSHGAHPIVNLTGHSVDRYHQHAGLSIPNVAATASGSIPLGTAVAIEPFATRGTGKVKDSGPGNIYHFNGARPVRDATAKKALAFIQREHPDLPFAGRWIKDAVPEKKVDYALRVLERSGVIRQYPILREASNGQVAQFEHTVLVDADGCTITTKSRTS